MTDDDLDVIRRIALARGLGAPYLCDGTCDTCSCFEWWRPACCAVYPSRKATAD